MARISSFSGTSIGAALMLLLLAATTPKANAVCITGSLSLDSNNCTTFDNSSPSTATLAFEDASLNDQPSPPRNGANYFQLIFDPLAGSPYSITNFEWSRGGDLNNVNAWSWTAFQAALNTASSATTSTEIVDVSPSATTPLGSPFYVRYVIPAGIPVGTVIDITFRANNNNAVLASTDPNYSPDFATLNTSSSLTSGVRLTRDNVATTSVPAPLPVLGLAIAMSHASKLRRRVGRRHLR